MGAMKDFDLFCRNHDLDPNKSSSMRNWMYGEVQASIRVDDGRDLTWEDIEELTGGQIGKFSCACPYCGLEKTYSSRFQVDLTLNRAKWHCFYCLVSGEAESDVVFDPAEEQAALQETRRQKRRQRDANARTAIRIWDEAGPINGTLGETYLKTRRITLLPEGVDDVLRWHPRCRFDRDGPAGCIIALFRDALTDQPTGIHRTKIVSASGGLAKRAALGRMAGSAIKLWPLKQGDALAVGEGIETVLAAVQLGVVSPPAWAAT